MGIIVAIIVGGIIGWLASIVMRTDAQQGILLNIVVGIIGSFIGNVVGGMFGYGSTLTAWSPVGLLWSFIGALILLALINLARRGRVR
ncbi:GlsB/YeaQ/YmgE family stress response membrane protein [Sphingomonas sp. FW199]|uniref:GlsB/YeaQ/YmgE family stress response membrane protein n=1 Tax=Sphingomonas sp. FW199 TaxID=3400217 RepID=UPI003CF655C3